MEALVNHWLFRALDIGSGRLFCGSSKIKLILRGALEDPIMFKALIVVFDRNQCNANTK